MRLGEIKWPLARARGPIITRLTRLTLSRLSRREGNLGRFDWSVVCVTCFRVLQGWSPGGLSPFAFCARAKWDKRVCRGTLCAH